MEQRTTTRTWTENSARLRVLIETDDEALAVSDFSHFTGAGLAIAVCRGPVEDATECPLVRDEPCPLAAGADAILFRLGPESAAVLHAARRHHEATPIVVQPPDVRAGAGLAVPAGCDVLPAFSSVSGQVRAVRRAALAGRRHMPTSVACPPTDGPEAPRR